MQYADVAVHSRVGTRDAIFTYTIPPEILSAIALGSVVEIPFRKKRTLGVIVRLRRMLPRTVSAERLKPIRRALSDGAFFHPKELELRTALAPKLREPASRLLTLLLPPPSILASAPPLTTQSFPNSSLPEYRLGLAIHDQAFLHAQITSCLHRNRTVTITAPTKHDLLRWQEWLATQGFAESTTLHDPTAPITQQRRAWALVLGEQPGIILGARSTVFLPVRQLGLQIIDQATHHQLLEEQSPHYHALDVARARQQFFGGQLIAYSPLPALATFTRQQRKRWKFHRTAATKPNYTLMHANPRERVSRATLNVIEAYLAQHKSVLVITPQRGWAHGLYCQDCETTLRCPDCDRVLTQKARGELSCRSCAYQSSSQACPHCHGVRLQSFGWGSSLWASYFSEQLPQHTIIELTEPTILPNTLTVTAPVFDDILPTPADLVVILHPEKFRATTNYLATEHWLRLLWTMRTLAVDRLLVETATPDEPVFHELQDDLPTTTIAHELGLRKKYDYPPFGKKHE